MRLVLLAAGGATAVLAADLAARRVVEADAAASLASHPGLHIGGVTAAPLLDRLDLANVSIQRGKTRVTIGRLALPLPGLSVMSRAIADPATQAAPAPSGGTVALDDVTVVQGVTTYRAKRIEVAGTALSQADLAALLDAKSAESLESRLKKLSATAVVIPEIDIDDATIGSERHAELRQVLLANVVAGKAGAASAAETSLALTDGAEAINGASGPIEASGVDLAQVAHVGTTAGSSADEPIKPLFDKLVITAPKLTNVSRMATIAATSISVTGAQGRPLGEPLPVAGATPAKPGLDPASMRAVVAILRSFAAKDLAIDGLSSSGKTGGDTTRITLAHLGLENVGDGKVGALHLRDFQLDGGYARFAIGSGDMADLSFPTLGDRPRTLAAQLDLRQIAVAVDRRERQPSGDSVLLRFGIAHVSARQSGVSAAGPLFSGTTTVDDLAFDATPSGLTQTLYAMGYRHVSVSIAMTSAYDPAAGVLKVEPLTITESAMGSLSLSVELAGVAPGILSSNPDVVQAAAASMVAKMVDLKVTNKGLFDKAMALKAAQDGLSVANERAYAVDLFANKLPMIGGGGPAVTAVGAAIGKFIADPKTLHVSIGSKAGLGLATIGQLDDPGALLDSLDVKASADD